jgi:uncharacterized protein (TIGR04255 family)
MAYLREDDMTEGPIPSYKKPPLIEVAWSVQFADLSWMTASHVGLFWQRIRDDFPTCEEQAPLPKQEEPDSLLAPARSSIRFSMRPPLARQWFVSADKDELVQLQQDRFCFNWRKVRATDPYPRYAHLRDQFAKYWRQFGEFLKEEGDTTASIELLEMTYLNHILQGEGWAAPGDIGKVFPSISFKEESKFLRAPGTLACMLVYDLSGSQGRLHVSCQHAMLQEPPGREAFVLDLTARGKPKQTGEEGLLDWFANAHEWIVRSFADLTDAKVQSEFWERER